MEDKTMSDKTGGTISEEDVSMILQRYTPTTVITLLQEIAQVPDVKIDWDALVKQTKTGITNPREYQMLWRHLAYRDPLIEKFEDDAEPLDDDSDLEYELEAFPPVSNEESAEAAACVKVHIASGATNKSSVEKGLTMEGPLTINIPRVNSASGVNISIPVSVPTHVQIAPGEGFVDSNTCGNSNLPPRRKRKPWSAEEDNQLFAAVQKCGEGNWANISKGEFKGERTPSQLSQRWSIIKKRQSQSNIKTGSQLSEAQLAARRALNMALDVDNPKQPSSSIGIEQGSRSQQVFGRSQQAYSGSDAVKAAAVAAGARIATQTAAAAILKAQLKGAIHIKTGGNNNRPPSEYFRTISPRPNLGSGSTHVNAVASSGTTIKQEQVAELGSKDQEQQPRAKHEF